MSTTAGVARRTTSRTPPRLVWTGGRGSSRDVLTVVPAALVAWPRRKAGRAMSVATTVAPERMTARLDSKGGKCASGVESFGPSRDAEEDLAPVHQATARSAPMSTERRKERSDR